MAVSDPPSTAGAAASVWLRVARRIARHPRLWVPALRQALRSTPRGWWRRPPFVPRPDRRYLAFRWETQYGATPGSAGRETATAVVDADDVVAYLEWCARSEQARRRARSGRRARR